jgi:hypothetical protein
MTLVITVRERDDRRGIFDAHHDGLYLCSSPSPFIDGCRILVSHGHDPRARVEMRREGSDVDALSGRLGAVAGIEVASRGIGFHARRERSTASLERSGEVAGTTLARDPIDAPSEPLPTDAEAA